MLASGWGSFALCVLWGIAVLWVPGYALLRAARLPRVWAVACAPVPAVVLYATLGVVYDKLGVYASWLTMAAFAAVASGLLLAVVRPWRKPARVVLGAGVPGELGVLDGAASSGASAVSSDVLASVSGKSVSSYASDTLRESLGVPACLHKRFDAKCLVLYVAVGFFVACLFTAFSLKTADGFAQSFDSMHHLGMIRTFVETGCWSSLDVAAYSSDMHAAVMPIAGWSFYPTAWHSVAALMASVWGVPVTVAANATNFLFAGLVYPASSFALLRFVFRDNVPAFVCGAFVSCAFMAFPWQMVNWGPLYPNLAAFSLVPAVSFFFMAVFREGAPRADRAAFACLFVIGLAALAFTQPNAVFTMAVLLAPYCVVLSRRIPSLLGGAHDTSRGRGVSSAIAVALVAVVWAALFSLPFLRDVVWHVWPAYTEAPDALGNVLLLSYRETLPQVVLALLVLVGAVAAWRGVRYRWVVAAYAFMAVVYIVTLTTDGVAKQLLAGFWYTDAARLGSSMALYGVPLASLGLACVVVAARRKAVLLEGSACGMLARVARGAYVALPALIIAAFLVVNFRPVAEGPVRSAFGDLAASTRSMYDAGADDIYSPEERAFVERALAITGDDLVLNMPDDGSEFAYAVSGMQTYYRYSGPYGKPDETPESHLIRMHLRSFASNEGVRDAVEKVGAQYVLLLDQGDVRLEGSRHLYTFHPWQWGGISRVDDETPGFEVVLAEGDMRLYRIVGA